MWHLYILNCSDNSLYTGITNNLENRIKAHNTNKGAKYTRGRTPVELIYTEEWPDKSSALKREYRVKQLTRQQKLDLIGDNMVSFNVCDILGLELSAAEKLLKDHRKTFRVQAIDGKLQTLSNEIVHGRVSLIVVDGKVEAYNLG